MPSPSEADNDITRTGYTTPVVLHADELVSDPVGVESPLPAPHVALSEAQLMMQDTLPPLPMFGGARDLLALAGGVALDNGSALSSERCATDYHGVGHTDDLSKSDTDQVPAFHFDPISSMSDDEVMTELLALVSTEGASVERRIMLFLARRYFAVGFSAYGAVKLFDGRDNRREMREESADFLFYFGKEQLERERA